MEMMGLAKWRRMIFAELPEGKVLEIGIGTGKNIQFYPEKGRDYIGIDISTAMLERAKARIKERGIKVDIRQMDVEKINFADHTFDCVISTCVFCSVPDPVKGLMEARRVLKPGGIALFLEHMRPENRFLGKFFDILNVITVKLFGFNINRRTVENIKKAGFEVIEEQNLFSDIFRLIKARP